jgi:dolichyl-diphosphooligosaccharide--protein glycosyltransferase
VGKSWARTASLLLVLFALALTARCLNYSQIFSPQGVLYFGVDPYYHVRRSILTALDYPQVPRFDSYSGFPRGMESHFAPLWDITVASLALLHDSVAADPVPEGSTAPQLGGNSSLENAVRFWSAILPPVLGAFTVILTYFVARLLVSPLLAFMGALLLAVTPAHLDYTLLGRPDHHVLESLLTTLSVFLYMYLLATKGTKRNLPCCLLLGLSLAAAILSSVQCILFAALIALYSYIYAIRMPSEGEGHAASMLKTFGSMLIFLIAGTALTLPGNLLEFHYDRPSLYQIAALILLCVPLAAFQIWRSRDQISRLTGMTVLTAIAVGWTAMLGILLVPTLRGLNFIGRTAEWIGDVQDAYPLLLVGGELNLIWPIGQLGLVWLGLPLWIALGLPAAKEQKEPWTFLIFWTVATFTLSLYQVRFLYFFATAIPCLFVAALSRFNRSVPNLRSAPAGRTRLLSLGVFIVFPIALQSPAIWALTARIDLHSIDADVVDACLWLKERTPATSHLYQPNLKPEYGVLSHWDLGNQVILLGERPAVATASHQANMEGIEESIRFFLSQKEQYATRILERNGARYVLTESRVGDFNNQAPIIGKQGSYSITETVDGQRIFRLTDLFQKSMYAQLHLHDGTGTEENAPLERFRLVYESPRREAGFMGIHHVKIFELVPAALLRGCGQAGEQIELVVQLATQQGREFQYRRKIRAPDNGCFSISIPYSTDPPAGYVRVKPPVLVQGETLHETLQEIPEAAVLEGREIALSQQF